MPFLLLEIYLNDKNKYSLNKLFNKVLNKYKKFDNSSGVFIELNHKKNSESLYLFSGSKKKNITEQALKGYVRVLNLDIEYSIYDLYRYENIYFIIAMYLNKIKLINLSNYFNKKGMIKVYKELKNTDEDKVFVQSEP